MPSIYVGKSDHFSIVSATALALYPHEMEWLLQALVQAFIAQDIHLLIQQLLRHVRPGLLDDRIHSLILGLAELRGCHAAHWTVDILVPFQAFQVDQMATGQGNVMLDRVLQHLQADGALTFSHILCAFVLVFLAYCTAVPTVFAMEEILNFASPAHLALITVEDIINFGPPVLVQFTFQAGVLAESHFAFRVATLEAGLLDFLTVETADVGDLLEGHPFHLAAIGLGACVLFIVAQLARVIELATWGFNFAVTEVMLAAEVFLLFLLFLFYFSLIRR